MCHFSDLIANEYGSVRIYQGRPKLNRVHNGFRAINWPLLIEPIEACNFALRDQSQKPHSHVACRLSGHRVGPTTRPLPLPRVEHNPGTRDMLEWKVSRH